MKIECAVCKTGELKSKKIYRFPGIIVFLGWVIALPSLFMATSCLLATISMAIASMSPNVKHQGTMLAGSLAGGGIGITLSLLGGTLGFIFLLKKRVLKCTACSCTINQS